MPYSVNHPDILRNRKKWNAGTNVVRVLGNLEGQRLSEFESLVQRTIEQMRLHETEDVVSIDYLTAGKFAHIFHASLEPDISFILQVARGKFDSEAGKIVERDFQNLRWLETLASDYFPRAFAKERMRLSGVDEVPVLTTEFFRGYEELNYTDKYSGQGNFFQNSRENGLGEKNRLKTEASIELMKSIVRVMAYVYARTYDRSTNRGLFINNVSIDSGDFLYKVNPNVDGPLVRMITAREIESVSPREFLFYLLMPFDSYSIGRYVLSEFRIKKDKKSTDTIVAGVKEGVYEVFPEDADNIFTGWVSDVRANLTDDLDKLGVSLAEGRLQSFGDLPVGYRAYAKLIAMVAHRNSRKLQVTIPYETDYAKAWEAQRTSLAPHLKLAGERVLKYLSQAVVK